MSALFQDKRTRITVDALKLSKEADIDSLTPDIATDVFFLGSLD